MTLASHPLQPFIPQGAKLLLLGSFPPPLARWSMPFFYPNYINDMWRVMGLIYHQEANYYVDTAGKTFDQNGIENLLTRAGIALYDVAQQVDRVQDNAADKFLTILTPTDLPALIQQMPQLRAVASTGQKSAEEVSRQLNTPLPRMGSASSILTADGSLSFYRMPSTSRAYPLPLAQKAAYYQRLLTDCGCYPLTGTKGNSCS